MKLINLSAKLAILAIVTTFSIAAFAHDSNPPSWRNEPNPLAAYTYQTWEFNTNTDPVLPNMVNNIFGSPYADINVGDYGSGWHNLLPGMGTLTGYWDIGGQGGYVKFFIPNRPESPPNSYKDIRVQVTCFIDITGPAIVTIPNATLIDSGQSIIETVRTGGTWINYWYDFHMEPNPTVEWVNVSSYKDGNGFYWGSVIEEVIVDTRCVVPEQLVNVTGVVVDSNPNAQNCNDYLAGRSFTWKILSSGETGVGTVGSGGSINFSCSTTGASAICLKVSGSLSRKLTGLYLNGTVNLGIVAITLPDYINDDVWDDFDLNEINGGFGNFVSPGTGMDYNCDGVYDDFDLNHINGGFGTTGECFGL